MPGPCSAPNGNWMLTHRTPKENENINTGKTAKKRGHLNKEDQQRTFRKMNRAEFERLNES
jgi:hypothetical protein